MFFKFQNERILPESYSVFVESFYYNDVLNKHGDDFAHRNTAGKKRTHTLLYLFSAKGFIFINTANLLFVNFIWRRDFICRGNLLVGMLNKFRGALFFFLIKGKATVTETF